MLPLFQHPHPLSWNISPNLILSFTFNLFRLMECQQSDVSWTFRTLVWFNSHFLVLPSVTARDRQAKASPQVLVKGNRNKRVKVRSFCQSIKPIRWSAGKPRSHCLPPNLAGTADLYTWEPNKSRLFMSPRSCGCFSCHTSVAVNIEYSNSTSTHKCHYNKLCGIFLGPVGCWKFKLTKKLIEQWVVPRKMLQGAEKIASIIDSSEYLGNKRLHHTA